MTKPEYDVAAALSGLRGAVRQVVSTPPAGLVRERADHRLRMRRTSGAILVGAAVVAMALGATAAVRWSAAPIPPSGPTTPAPDNTPTRSPRPNLPVPPWPASTINDPIAKVDFANATITVSSHQGCPSGRLRFSGGSTAAWPRIELALPPDWPLAYGDLTGDGRPEAIMGAQCRISAEDSGDGQGQLLVITRGSGGDLTALAWVGPRGGLYRAFWVSDRRLIVDVHPWHTDWGYSRGAALAYRWQAGGFAEVASGYPGVQPVGGEQFGPPIDLGPDEGPVTTALGCPGGQIRIEAGDRFGGEPGTSAANGDVVYSVEQPEAGLNVAHLIDLSGDGHRYVLIAITCYDGTGSRNDPPPNGPAVRGQGVLVLDWIAGGSLRAVDMLPVPLDRTIGGWRYDRGGITVSSSWIDAGSEAPQQAWVWNGQYFQYWQR